MHKNSSGLDVPREFPGVINVESFCYKEFDSTLTLVSSTNL